MLAINMPSAEKYSSERNASRSLLLLFCGRQAAFSHYIIDACQQPAPNSLTQTLARLKIIFPWGNVNMLENRYSFESVICMAQERSRSTQNI